jgi:hypothetical protein
MLILGTLLAIQMKIKGKKDIKETETLPLLYIFLRDSMMRRRELLCCAACASLVVKYRGDIICPSKRRFFMKQNHGQRGASLLISACIVAGRCCNLCKRNSEMQIRSKCNTAAWCSDQWPLENPGLENLKQLPTFARTLWSIRKGIQEISSAPAQTIAGNHDRAEVRLCAIMCPGWLCPVLSQDARYIVVA